ncbi:hypothetical protein Rs2_43204 [Raphanus sativus]|nr:hypothetical protein Rs2_43204 [Raphanus sativus]
MERDLAPIVEVLEENTSDHDPSLPSGGKTSRRVSRRSSLFRSHATTMSMSRRCSIQIVDSDSSSPTSEGSSPTAQNKTKVAFKAPFQNKTEETFQALLLKKTFQAPVLKNLIPQKVKIQHHKAM